MEVRIGVDPHKATHSAVAMEASGKVVAKRRFSSNAAGFKATLRWGEQFRERAWAIEGVKDLGLRLARVLAEADESVLDVPPLFAARVRTLSVGHGRKNDFADAEAAARVGWGDERLTPFMGEGCHATLRLLSERRDQVVRARTRLLNQLHILLRDLGVPGPRDLSADRAAALLRRVRSPEGPARARKELAKDLVADIRRSDRNLARLAERTREAVVASGTTLTSLRGVGPVLAAVILGEVGDVARFPNRGHFASYTGTAPIEVSSADAIRHRLSRAGNRRLNAALHMMAVSQISRPGKGRDYYERKRAEGKSSKEALRCLKRMLSDVVFRTLVADRAKMMPGEANRERHDGQLASRVVGFHPHTGASRSAIPGQDDPTEMEIPVSP